MQRTKIRPFPYFGEKKPCFHCCQMGDIKAKYAIVQNHKGFLCDQHARSHLGLTVKWAVKTYEKYRDLYTPPDHEIATVIRMVLISGFSGTLPEFFEFVREQNAEGNNSFQHVKLEKVHAFLKRYAVENNGIFSS